MAAAFGLSERGAGNVDAILPRISSALKERTNPSAPRIDLSTAENWLLREEIIQATKDGIQKELKPHVCNSNPGERSSIDCADDYSIYPIQTDLLGTPISFGLWPTFSIAISTHIFLSRSPTSPRLRGLHLV